MTYEPDLNHSLSIAREIKNEAVGALALERALDPTKFADVDGADVLIPTLEVWRDGAIRFLISPGGPQAMNDRTLFQAVKMSIRGLTPSHVVLVTDSYILQKQLETATTGTTDEALLAEIAETVANMGKLSDRFEAGDSEVTEAIVAVMVQRDGRSQVATQPYVCVADEVLWGEKIIGDVVPSEANCDSLVEVIREAFLFDHPDILASLTEEMPASARDHLQEFADGAELELDFVLRLMTDVETVETLSDLGMETMASYSSREELELVQAFRSRRETAMTMMRGKTGGSTWN